MALDQEAKKFTLEAYAPSTRQTYNTHRRTYLLFCEKLGYCPVPATTDVLIKYTVFLARSLTFSSIKQYLNIIHTLHREWDLPNPLDNNFHLTSLLRGIRRSLGDTVKQKAPITPELLKAILSRLNLADPMDACVWAVALILFFGLLRKASILPNKAFIRTDHRGLSRSDVKFYSWGMCLLIRHTKTIQFKQRTLEIPISRMPNNVLCPVQATFQAFRATPCIPGNFPAFCVPSAKGIHAITGQQFVLRIKQCLHLCGKTSKMYAGHSFRRGGATWAYRIGLPAEIIRTMGDWKSSAYLGYIDIDTKTVRSAITLMQSQV